MKVGLGFRELMDEIERVCHGLYCWFTSAPPAVFRFARGLAVFGGAGGLLWRNIFLRVFFCGRGFGIFGCRDALAGGRACGRNRDLHVNARHASQLAGAMLRYLQQPQALEADAQLVKNHCHQHFSIDTMVQRYQKLYEMTRMQS